MTPDVFHAVVVGVIFGWIAGFVFGVAWTYRRVTDAFDEYDEEVAEDIVEAFRRL